MSHADAPTTPAGRVAGSFRDPAGYVFLRDGQVFRAVSDDCHRVLGELADSGLLAKLVADRLVVETQFVADEPLRGTLAAEHPGFTHFLRHETITPLSYPYEWTVSMLADAGLATLDLQLRLLASGFGLKDASAYNIQFVDGRPRFVDLGSVERPRRRDVWFALGQFSQMFTFPLLLCRYHGWDLRSYFLGSPGGRGVQEIARGLGWLQRYRPRMLLDVGLPALLTRWAGRGDRARREILDQPREDAAPQVLNLRRLRRKIERLAAGYRPRGVWSDYTQSCSYDDAADAAKQSLVREFLQSTRPAEVLDLGCNTGCYSRLAAETAARVTAVDADHDAVEVLYRGLGQRPARIAPMVVDLANPSPGVGLMNAERPAWLERTEADCVLALALLHHLMVAGNLPLAAVRDLLLRLTRRDLVLEFVPADDPMFRRLMQFRVDLFGDLTLDACRAVFCQGFELVREAAIPGTQRTLFFFRKPVAPGAAA